MGRGKKGWNILKNVSKAAIYFIVFAVGIPLILGSIAGFPSGQILTLITSTFVLQAASAPVGLAMGLPAGLILVIMACFALGIVLAILEVCDSLTASSTRIKHWVDKIEEKTRRHPQIQKYGPITCIGIAWIPGVGLYGTPVIAWILKWKRVPAVFFTVCGFLVAATFVIFFVNRIGQVLQFAGNSGVVLFAIISMLALGFSADIRRLPDLLENRFLLILSLIANFIIIPFFAILFAQALNFSGTIAIGFILVGCAAGSATLPGLAEISKGNILLAKGLALVLTILSILYIPLIFPFLSPIPSVNQWNILLTLVILMLIPLLSGFYVKQKKPVFADRWAPRMNKISGVVLVVVIIAFLVLNLNRIPGISQVEEFLIVTAAIVAFLVIALGVGYLLAGKDRSSGRVMALGTAQRNIAAAAAVAVFDIRDPLILLVVLFVGLISLIFIRYTSIWLGKKKE